MSLVSRSPLPTRLKTARKAKGISQKNLGILAGIDEFSASARMNHYEKGKHFPDFDTLERIAKILDVPVPYFYCKDDQLAELLVQYGRMPSEKKKKLLTFLAELETL
ncbi:XRE family transcriptional regulator [Endozoicomonas sp. OPT23]|uniref:helix-turn-helix domain-containing protein n=1 Tax=Endozoicomonas sp. OPT23 TaxID=2072845 RepID=UPI00129AC351|nr:helix-turn-helix transcriptional regulator [Endozoicomonas sp. OPT23]MRI34286.1 XRE family transcriptional regulator [Endozoicomonas sp. OPT23]